MERAVIRKIKRAGYSVAFGAYVVGNDAFGTWLFTPAESIARYVDGEDELLRPWPNFLSLAQTDEWFWAGWWVRDGVPTIGTDACTRPTFDGGEWSWIDLELDVLRDESGAVWVEDEDEFADAIAAGQIPGNEREAAIAVTNELERRLRGHVAPFDLATGWRHHDAAVALGLTALEAPPI